MKSRDYAAIGTMLLIGGVLILCAGCSSLPLMQRPLAAIADSGLLPDSVNVETLHVSHASVGSLRCHANCSEDSLTTVNLALQWHPLQGTYVELSEGYNIQGRNGGGFYGPAEVFTARIGHTFNLRN